MLLLFHALLYQYGDVESKPGPCPYSVRDSLRLIIRDRLNFVTLNVRMEFNNFDITALTETFYVKITNCYKDKLTGLFRRDRNRKGGEECICAVICTYRTKNNNLDCIWLKKFTQNHIFNFQIRKQTCIMRRIHRFAKRINLLKY